MPAAWRRAAAFAASLGLRRLRPHWLGLVVAILGPVLLTWPLAAEAGTSVLGALYHWDAYCNAMIMGGRVDALLGIGPLSLYDAYYFAPLPRGIVFNENHFGLSLLFAPFYLVGGPVWGYNLTLLTSLGLSVFFTYLLVRRLTGHAAAAAVCGVAFAFCPYVAFELGRIQLVATQWIPACFLTLELLIARRRLRDMALFWACFGLQIGTCLYYAMFLMPLLALLGALLLARQRPARRFYLEFGASALVAGAVALAMVAPYFAARSSFELERSLEFAARYDGKLAFFAHVHPLNRTWTALHHPVGRPLAPEEIAFPGLTVVLLALLGLWTRLCAAFRGRAHGRLGVAAGAWLTLAAVAVACALAARSFLPGMLLFGLGSAVLGMKLRISPFAGVHGAYLALLVLAVVLFLGLEPFSWEGRPVRGLYYYLYTYFPGYDGIRKVSRQAVMTSLLVVVLAGFGAAALLARLRRERLEVAGACALLAFLSHDLRCFPHPLVPVFAAEGAPPALEFVRKLPERDLVAAYPQNGGQRLMRGDAGMALHDYLALYHKHRFVNGQSSYEPPVTTLARRSIDALPSDAARRSLLAIGTRHLIVYGEELPPTRAHFVEALLAHPGEYRLSFQDGPHSVISLLGADDEALTLLDTPVLPAGLRRIEGGVRARASLGSEQVDEALDGDETTRWTTGRPQAAGQWFEVELAAPRRVRALEIAAPGHVMDVPAAFRLLGSKGMDVLEPLVVRPTVRLYREQIFSPKTFVWRVVLPEAVLIDRLHLALVDALPGYYFSIHELRLYAE